MEKTKSVRKYSYDEKPTFCVTVPGMRRSHVFLEEWIFLLGKTNAQAQNIENEFKDVSSNGRVVDLIFLICKKFRQNKEVKFLAVEIFDRFIFQHIAELRGHVLDNKDYNWDDVEARVTNQMLLRACTCIQIASKIVSQRAVRHCSEIKIFLEQNGFYYSLSNLISSELRVMKTLGYQVSIMTPLTYLENLLDIISHEIQNIELNKIYIISIMYLEIFYLKRDDIYEDLFEIVTKMESQKVESIFTPCHNETSELRTEFRKIKCDYLLLAASILTLAAGFEDKNIQNLVGLQVSHVTRFPITAIEDYCSVLEKYTIEKKV